MNREEQLVARAVSHRRLVEAILRYAALLGVAAFLFSASVGVLINDLPELRALVSVPSILLSCGLAVYAFRYLGIEWCFGKASK